MQCRIVTLVAEVDVKLAKLDDVKVEMSLLKHCLECEMLVELKPWSTFLFFCFFDGVFCH